MILPLSDDDGDVCNRNGYEALALSHNDGDVCNRNGYEALALSTTPGLAALLTSLPLVARLRCLRRPGGFESARPSIPPGPRIRQSAV